ncbi:mechanosensitive ion channel family protein [Lentilactobacillus sp. SPB1-3]|uniref:Mechanosensitive ion channel family protein n=1 Tax=Lentilactobacillus terminaliae TaxID=3003483 RepID=A0ACD5DC96_9LACO|nr:mechanosensitive ion channel family protein [Lentilactobacillus sp. SPB1-3]MCZ0977352.1 mechanosensitive ion channel family protein [Lentilactobacillus sp. SPB1-3]
MKTFNQLVSQHKFPNIGKYFDWDKILDSIIKNTLLIIIVIIFLLIINRIGKATIHHLFKQYRKRYSQNVTEKRILTFQTLSLNAFSYIIWFLLFYWILSIIGIPVGTLIASAGIFSLAIGLGAQGFVTDIVSGFFILLEKQIEVGEYVNINNVQGTVSAVGIRTTQVIADDGTLNFIPNRSIQTIANMSRNNMVAKIQIQITPETDINKAISLIEEVNQKQAKNYPDIVSDPTVVGVVSLPNNQLAIQINMTTKNGAQYHIQHDFLGLYLQLLRENDIKLGTSPINYK